ncbi:Hypothetical predicted protein [Mytilus galloprovincialis]|uniref:Carbohydrate sulfotransferase n=1 Tax=Mytilus galloprovincialis TaxID=29158 RepID=A0A8B6HU97_MYTGA|nr:Hypothetical predicted protein [Mytilus galloprovincialis]
MSFVKDYYFKITGICVLLIVIYLSLFFCRNLDKYNAKRAPLSFYQDITSIKSSVKLSPIVVPKYKLIFFWNSKSGGTYWKNLLQFIQGFRTTGQAAHRPRSNRLQTLTNFTDSDTVKMFMDKSWTKTVFVREPRERILSAYLHVESSSFKPCRRVVSSFSGFLQLIKTCKNIHWESQVQIPEKFYRYMMIGKISKIKEFSEKLLKKIGAWNEKVQMWLRSRNLGKFTKRHATKANKALFNTITIQNCKNQIFEMFIKDYKVFQYAKKYF